jgi:hypothetical protein
MPLTAPNLEFFNYCQQKYIEGCTFMTNLRISAAPHMSKTLYHRIIIIFGLLVTLGLIVFAIYNKRYLDAVAASCVGPALIWFALGTAKSKDQ